MGVRHLSVEKGSINEPQQYKGTAAITNGKLSCVFCQNSKSIN
jgi:hypothetical protein